MQFLLNPYVLAVSGGGSSQADTHWHNVKLLMALDAANGSIKFADRAGHFMTSNGNAQIDTAQYKFGYASAYFDDSGDYVESGASDDWDFGTGDFTIEGWFRFASFTTANDLLGHYQVDNTGWFIRATSTQLVIWGGNVYNNVSYSFSVDTWYHIAITRSSGTLRAFINGTKVSEVTATESWTTTTSETLRIGRTHTVTTVDMHGWMDEVRITKNVARYTADFTAPTEAFPTYGEDYTDSNWANTTLLLHLDGSDGSFGIVDAKGHVFTRNAGLVNHTRIKSGTASYYFDGSGDYFDTPNSADFAFGSGDFTVEAWVYMQAYDTGLPQEVLSFWSNTGGWAWEFGFSAANWLYFNVNGTTLLGGGITTFVGGWHHIAATRNGSNWRLFVDGAVVHSVSSSATIIATTAVLRVGAVSAPATWYFKGWMDDIRITKGVARYTANFTPETRPLPHGSTTGWVLSWTTTDDCGVRLIGEDDHSYYLSAVYNYVANSSGDGGLVSISKDGQSIRFKTVSSATSDITLGGTYNNYSDRVCLAHRRFGGTYHEIVLMVVRPNFITGSTNRLYSGTASIQSYCIIPKTNSANYILVGLLGTSGIIGEVNSDMTLGTFKQIAVNLYSVILSSGSYYVGGNDNATDTQASLTKVASDLSSATWTRRLYSTGLDLRTYNIASDSSGNIYSTIVNATNYNYSYLAKFDSDGNLIWQKQISCTGTNWISAISDVSDGLILIVQRYSSYGFNLVKIDYDGTIVWQKLITSSYSMLSVSTIQYLKADDNIVVAAGSDASPPTRLHLFKLPTTGLVNGTYGNYTIANGDVTVAASSLTLSTAALGLSTPTISTATPTNVWTETNVFTKFTEI